MLVVLGKYAQAAGSSIFIGIDELQYASKEELEALTCALHRATQLGLPVMLGCAGLPKLLKMLGEAKTYSERQFNYVKVDSLPRDKAVEAIVRPAHKLDVGYSNEAVNAIIDYTGGGIRISFRSFARLFGHRQIASVFRWKPFLNAVL